MRLLHTETETISGMSTELLEAGVLHDCARHVGMSTEAAIAWAIDSLVDSGQAVRQGDSISNCDPARK